MTYHLDQNILEFTILLMGQHGFCMKQVEHSSITSRFEFWAFFRMTGYFLAYKISTLLMLMRLYCRAYRLSKPNYNSNVE
jgi:hypothetical protein